MSKPEQLNKAQRRRIWRALKGGNWPFGHLRNKDLKGVFDEEVEKCLALHEEIKQKAIKLGYDPKEDLVQ